MKFRHDHAGTDGAEAIGWLADATPVEQQIVRCVRLWMTGADDREAMWNVLAADLGTQEARRVLRAFEAFIASIAVSIERKINRHALDCPCICRDEAALLEIVRQAGRGDGFRAAAHAAVLVRKDRVAAVVDAADGLASEIARGGGYLNQGPTWRGPEPAGGTLHRSSESNDGRPGMTAFRKLTLAAIAAALPLLVSAAEKSAVLDQYAKLAEAKYADSLATAEALGTAIDALIAAPSAEALAAAKAAWLQARIPYQQTEVYRFGNAIVDDWEGKVNAWPLDEGLIDYVDSGYGGPTDENPYAALNVVANASFTLSGTTVDAAKITPDLLSGTLHEADAVEANVATGYHAIEFLLWGQDLNGTGPGAGNRPWTDFAHGDACTRGNCERRGEYLKAASDLLISDLTEMADAWKDGGAARAELAAKGEDGGIVTILTGMGSLSYGEQAGERMKLGLMLHDPEEEHDCFSDNTHNSHYFDGLGIRNVYLGQYQRTDGTTVEGASISDLVTAIDPALDAEMRRDLDQTMAALGAIKSTAEAGTAYDQMLAAGNAEGEAMVQAAIDALVAQTRTIERVVAALQLDPIAIEGSDSLDNPSAVFQ